MRRGNVFRVLRICLQYISRWTISCEALPQKKKKSRSCEEIYRGFSETVPKHYLAGFPHNVSIIIVIAASRPLSQTSIHWLTCVRNWFDCEEAKLDFERFEYSR